MVDIENSVISLLKDSASKLKEIFNFTAIPEISLDIPRQSLFGDLASNIALKIGRQTRHPAKEIAHIMADQMRIRLKEDPYRDIIKNIEVGAPGFINFFLKGESLYYIMEKIRKEGARYGRNSIGAGQKLCVEFVSANPTGPLTIAHGRQAAYGDSLAKILEFSGFRVKREYYINDEGRQMALLGASIRARYLELVGGASGFPDDGYRGDYIIDIAVMIKKKYGRGKRAAPPKFFMDYGCKFIMNGIKEELRRFGVGFDTWFSQKKLMKSGKIKAALSVLRNKKLIYDKDGAVWFKTSVFGDEKDRVIKKSDGSYTYFGPDIAYHADKYRRGYDGLIDIWGPDHHGYIPRMKAAVEGLGRRKESFSPLIVQLVSLYRGKTPIPMSTRAGSFITLKEVVDEIGRDCARFFFLMRRRDSHLDFDLELAKKHSMDNPVYYIQYAHARICSILKYKRAEFKTAGTKGADPNRLKTKEEFRLLSTLRQFPFAVRSGAQAREPYRLLTYLEELAKIFHNFYNKHRVVSDDVLTTKARVVLIECVRTVIANGLRLLGVDAPVEM